MTPMLNNACLLNILHGRDTLDDKQQMVSRPLSRSHV